MRARAHDDSPRAVEAPGSPALARPFGREGGGEGVWPCGDGLPDPALCLSYGAMGAIWLRRVVEVGRCVSRSLATSLNSRTLVAYNCRR
jgi:hypothetical protein